MLAGDSERTMLLAARRLRLTHQLTVRRVDLAHAALGQGTKLRRERRHLVGMVLLRNAPVGGRDLFAAGVRPDAENLTWTLTRLARRTQLRGTVTQARLPASSASGPHPLAGRAEQTRDAILEGATAWKQQQDG